MASRRRRRAIVHRRGVGTGSVRGGHFPEKDPSGAWRYSPESTDADTSVSGAVLVGLLAARNAGIEVPDASIDKAIEFYKSMTSESGEVGYSRRRRLWPIHRAEFHRDAGLRPGPPQGIAPV